MADVDQGGAHQPVIHIHQLDEMKSKWLSFERHAVMTPYQSFHWLHAWYRHIGRFKKIRPLIAEGRYDDRTAFILPLMLERRFGCCVCRWLGGKTQNENAGLFEQEWLCLNKPSADSIFEEIRKQAPEIDLFFLEKQPAFIDGIRNPFAGTGTTFSHADPIFKNTMGENFESWEQSQRSRGSRNRLRRKRKKLSEKYGTLTLQLATDFNCIDRHFATFAAQRAKALEERSTPNPFSSAELQSFLVDALKASAGAECGFQMHRLETVDNVHAVHLGFFWKDRYSGFSISINHSSIEFSPGKIIQRDILEIAHANGVRKIDFGLGNP